MPNFANSIVGIARQAARFHTLPPELAQNLSLFDAETRPPSPQRIQDVQTAVKMAMEAEVHSIFPDEAEVPLVVDAMLDNDLTLGLIQNRNPYPQKPTLAALLILYHRELQGQGPAGIQRTIRLLYRPILVSLYSRLGRYRSSFEDYPPPNILPTSTSLPPDTQYDKYTDSQSVRIFKLNVNDLAYHLKTFTFSEELCTLFSSSSEEMREISEAGLQTKVSHGHRVARSSLSQIDEDPSITHRVRKLLLHSSILLAVEEAISPPVTPHTLVYTIARLSSFSRSWDDLDNLTAKIFIQSGLVNHARAIVLKNEPHLVGRRMMHSVYDPAFSALLRRQKKGGLYPTMPFRPPRLLPKKTKAALAPTTKQQITHDLVSIITDSNFVPALEPYEQAKVAASNDLDRRRSALAGDGFFAVLMAELLFELCPDRTCDFYDTVVEALAQNEIFIQFMLEAGIVDEDFASGDKRWADQWEDLLGVKFKRGKTPMAVAWFRAVMTPLVMVARQSYFRRHPEVLAQVILPPPSPVASPEPKRQKLTPALPSTPKKISRRHTTSPPVRSFGAKKFYDLTNLKERPLLLPPPVLDTPPATPDGSKSRPFVIDSP